MSLPTHTLIKEFVEGCEQVLEVLKHLRESDGAEVTAEVLLLTELIKKGRKETT